MTASPHAVEDHENSRPGLGGISNVPTSNNVASTISTGGAGTTFEHQVSAAFLASVLTQTFIPVFSSAVATKLHLQVGRLQWKTDDFVVEALEQGTVRRLLAAQVKRTFTLGESNEDCREVFSAAWSDFRNHNLFNPDADALVLIVHLGTNRLLGDFAWLLQQARTAISLDDFKQRLVGAGTLNKRSKEDYELVTKIISSESGAAPSEYDLWAFLRCFHVLSYDLTSSGAKDEASIKSLLAQLATEGDPAAAAATTWQELKGLTSVGAGTGASYGRSDLPASIQARHRIVGVTEHQAITAIRAHSDIVLARVADHGTGGLLFSRIEAAAAAAQALAHSPITIVVGPAGSGKSMLAKHLIRSLTANEFTMAFSAEEFTAPHINQVLTNAQVGVNWSTLCSLLALHPAKIILLEGLERLLESDQRGALNDLINTAVTDPSFRLVLTCRDYHAQTVEWVMVRPAHVSLKQVVVPELTDVELDQAAQKFPTLVSPLSAPALRRLLRNPFMLNQAAMIEWQHGDSLPQNERALRERLWRMVIRRDDHPRDGLPTRRASMLTNIALARARSLKPFVEVPKSDEAAVTALAVDNLISFDSSRTKAAPAHDVFEDWALIEWLHVEFDRYEHDDIAFARDRDTNPAMRRAYRRWLHELVETQPERSRDFIQAVTGAASLPNYLRDDTLIAVLQSSDAAAFLQTYAETLLSASAEQLKRVMHLVRVSCKTVSPLTSAKTLKERLYVPAGAAWPNVLDFLASRWSQMPDGLIPQIITFVEEWADGVSWLTPYPDGSASAGVVLEKLWPVAHRGYRDESPKQRVLKVMLKIPKSVEATFKDLVARRQKSVTRRDDMDADLFGETLLGPFMAGAATRDYPRETMAVCRAVLKADPPEDHPYYSPSREIECVFGLRDHASPSFFPAGASQGPFKALLNNRPSLGIPFIVRLLNDSVEFYGKGTAELEFVELPSQIEIKLSNGSISRIWSNQRLWNSYRGLSVMPHVLESALMALEAFFLEWSEHTESAELVQKYLLWVLENSNNVSTISVVASVCMAHPRLTIDAGAVLLGCKPLFRLDQSRMVQESAVLAPGGMGFFEEMLQRERMKSNRLPHRRKDLEHLAKVLALVDQDRVWAILDAHHAALPPLQNQTDEDRFWRLALSRMDLRKYESTGVTEDGHITIQMAPVDADVQEAIDRDLPRHQRFQKRTSLFVWSMKQHERDSDASPYSGEWPQRLIEAKEMAEEVAGQQPEPGESFGGIGITAAVCLRDHWDGLSPQDLQWCIDIVSERVLSQPEGDFISAAVQINPYNGVPACAYVASLIWLRRPDDPELWVIVTAALTHFNDGVRKQALEGVAEFLLPHSHEHSAFCTWVLVTDAQMEKSRQQNRAGLPRQERISPEQHWLDRRRAIFENAVDDWFETYPDLGAIEFGDWSDRRLARDLLVLFGKQTSLPEAHALFVRIAFALKAWWSMDGRGRSSGQSDYELQHEAHDALASFLLSCQPAEVPRLMAPILDAVERGSKGVGRFMGSLLSHESRSRAESRYWQVWKLVADKVAGAGWLKHMDHEHHDGHSLIAELFLNTRWREGIQSWSRLGVHFRDVDALFQQLPASPFVLQKYAHYLFHIGRESLPQALVSIVSKFGDNLEGALSPKGNSSWYLEGILSRLMYTDLGKLKESAAMRQAVMALLDALVTSGSSMAFRLRDDFVTPLTQLAE